MQTYRQSTTLAEIFQRQLDSSVPDDQLAWLRAELLNATQQCSALVVVGHHAVYGGGQHAQSARQQDLKVRLDFPGVFAWLGVDSYYNGHDHILEHDMDAQGVNYFTTGAGSDVRTNNVDIPEQVFQFAGNGFVIES